MLAYFQIAFGIFSKASPSAYPFISLKVFIQVQIKLISIPMVEHKALIWNRGQK